MQDNPAGRGLQANRKCSSSAIVLLCPLNILLHAFRITKSTVTLLDVKTKKQVPLFLARFTKQKHKY